MSTLKLTYLQHQAATNTNIALDANNLTTITGNLAVTGVIQGNINTLGAIVVSTSTVSDRLGSVRLIPVNNQAGSYSLTANDVGQMISVRSANVFVPNAVFSAGDNITVYNNSSSSITVTQNSAVTMYLVGSATTGNRTLAQRGIATVFCVSANTFVISGGGLS
jgi:hypothetical protein